MIKCQPRKLMKIFSPCSILILCLTLASCGTKGPLYIPEEKYPQSQLEQTSHHFPLDHISTS